MARTGHTGQLNPLNLQKRCLTTLTLLAALLGVAHANDQGLEEPLACSIQKTSEKMLWETCTFTRQVPGRQPPEVTQTEGRLHLLRMQGDLEETAFQHGMLLAQETEDGLLRYVEESKARFLRNLAPRQKRLFSGLVSCFIQKMVTTADSEFIAVHRNLARGMHAAGFSRYNEEDLVELSLSSELAVSLSGLQRLIARRPIFGYSELIRLCGGHLLKVFLEDGGKETDLKPEVFRLMKQPDLSSIYPTLGCSGFAGGPELMEDDSLWMGRNLDGSALGFFDRNPVVILHEPTEAGKLKSVGIASAGLHYAGGITGFNEAGIGVTIHEMETENFRINTRKGTGVSGLFLQNRILERARNIDEAWEIVRNAGHYTAWTIVISDTKTNEIATIEFTGRKAVLAKRQFGGVHLQSNHFQAREMRHQFYNYSYNKVLESRFRLKRMEQLLQQAPPLLGPQWVLNVLTDHTDALTGERLFGRNLTKTNTLMSHVFSPMKQEFILSLGNTYPVSTGQFLHLGVSFDSADRTKSPFLKKRLMRSENFEQKNERKELLQHYVHAYMRYVSPEPNAFGGSGDWQGALFELEHALHLMRESDVVDFSLLHMSGRLRLKLAAVESRPTLAKIARENFQEILLAHRNHSMQLHPYDEALVRIWIARSVAVETALHRQIENLEPGHFSLSENLEKVREENLIRARKLLDILLSDESQDFELRQLRAQIKREKVGKGKNAIDLAKDVKIDFVTVE